MPPRFCQLHSVAHPRNDAPRYAFRYFWKRLLGLLGIARTPHASTNSKAFR